MAEQTVTVDLFYDDGGGEDWQDISAAVYARDDFAITITRGRQDETQQPAPMTANLTLDNRTGEYNPANPASPLYGLVGRNTPIRIFVGGSQRFIGEVASWTPRRSVDFALGAGRGDAWVDVVAAGQSRRLGQGADPLKDTVHRFMTEGDGATNLIGYWPLDDPDGSTEARAVVGRPFQIGGGRFSSNLPAPPRFDGGELRAWLPPGVETEAGVDGALNASVAGGEPGGFAVDLLYRATKPPSESGEEPTPFILLAVTTSIVRNVAYQVVTPSGSGISVQVIDADDFTTLQSATDSAGSLHDGQAHHIRLRVLPDTGTNQGVFIDVDGVNALAFLADTGEADPGAPSALVFAWQEAPTLVIPVRWSQVALWNEAPPGLTDSVEAYNGHAFESAGARVQRLCSEEGVPFGFFVSQASLEASTLLGPQFPDTFLEILAEAAATDLGWLDDRKAAAGLQYQTGAQTYNLDPVLELDFDADGVAPPFDPVLDDQTTRNDITATNRATGGTARRVLDAGALSVQAPPAGVGRVKSSPGVNVASDQAVPNQAGWRLHLGTDGSIRYPKMTVDLDAAPGVSVGALDEGRRITIANLPADLSPDLADLLVLGWTETVGPYRRIITFNCAPYRPWTVGVYGTDGITPDPDEPARYSPSASFVSAEFVAGTDTELTTQYLGPGTATSHGLDLWTEDAAAFPFDVIVSGVRLRVTSIASIAPFPITQVLTVAQTPINGVTKTIPGAVGIPVELWQPARYALGD